MNLQKAVADLPRILAQNLGVENKNRLGRDYASVVVAGVGGSGVVGDILAGLFPELKIATYKSFGLPRNVSSDSLVLAISYSGETKETIAALEEALAAGRSAAVIAGGGTLLAAGRDKNLPYCAVPYDRNVPTRFAIGHLLRAALEILEGSGLVGRLAEYLAPLAEVNFEPKANLATDLANSTVLVYAPFELYGLAQFWKEVLNETGKIPAFANTIPEALHNEIESIAKITDPLFLLLTDPQMDKTVQDRFSAFEKLAQEQNWKTKMIEPAGDSRLVFVVESLMAALDAGVGVARLRGVDPAETVLINKLRK